MLSPDNPFGDQNLYQMIPDDQMLGEDPEVEILLLIRGKSRHKSSHLRLHEALRRKLRTSVSSKIGIVIVI
jgi:hypothetical protein